MPKIRLTKKFNLEMGHSLYDYDGPCSNIHGHSYVLFVTVIGEPSLDKSHTKYGMVMDFKELKSIIITNIIARFDHALVLNSKTPESLINEMNKIYNKIIVVDYQPTCENLLIEFVDIIRENIVGAVKLSNVKLAETTSSFAEWHAEDNDISY